MKSEMFETPANDKKPKRLVEAIKRHKVKIIIVAVIVLIIVMGIGGTTAFARFYVLKKVDREITKKHKEEEDILVKVKKVQKSGKSTCDKAKQTQAKSEEFAGAIEEHDAALSDMNNRTLALNTRPHILESVSLVNRLNTIAGEYDQLMREISKETYELYDLDLAVIACADDTCLLLEDLEDARNELEDSTGAYRELLEQVDSRRKKISIFSLRFNSETKALKRKLATIKTDSMQDYMEEVTLLSEDMENAIGNFADSIEKRQVLHDSICVKENRCKVLLEQEEALAPK